MFALKKQRKIYRTIGLSAIAACAFQMVSGPAALAFALKDKDGNSIHGAIFKEALGNRVAPKNLKLLIEVADKTFPTTGQYFFSKGKLKSSASFVQREQMKAINFAHDADTNPKDRYRALKHLAMMLRACQDFYSHSKYLEIQAAREQARKEKVFDPYQMELFDWSKLGNASYLEYEGMHVDDGGRPMETEEEGSGKLGAATYFKAARELAVRETARQFDVYMAIVKQKYKARNLTITTALREASAPPVDDEDID